MSKQRGSRAAKKKAEEKQLEAKRESALKYRHEKKKADEKGLEAKRENRLKKKKREEELYPFKKPSVQQGMAEQLRMFIEQAAAEGYTRDQVKEMLKHVGWPASVREAYVRHFYKKSKLQSSKQELIEEISIEEQLQEIEEKLRKLNEQKKRK